MCIAASPFTRLEGELTAFKRDVVHLIKPTSLGVAGLRAAQNRGIPVVALSMAARTALNASVNASIFSTMAALSVVTVTVGATVRWTNHGQSVHSSTSDAGHWNWTMVPGASFSVQFLWPGTYPYHCVYHRAAGMTGTVVVTARAAPTGRRQRSVPSAADSPSTASAAATANGPPR